MSGADAPQRGRTPDPNADSGLRATDSAPAFPEPASSEPATGGGRRGTDPRPTSSDGETLDLELTGIAHGGRAVARHGGRLVFVPFGVPGELVRARVYRNRKRYAEAEIVEVVRRSPERVEPACPYYGVCGGCQLQHMSYSAQLDAKRQVVADQLARIGGFRDAVVHPTLPSPLEYGYRNTVRFLPGVRERSATPTSGRTASCRWTCALSPPRPSTMR
ncbi:MAG: TRAM domain-containing protein [Chloroflexia bacterium]